MKRPTFRIKILDKENNKKGTVGAGWLNEDGSITIQLEPGTNISYEESKNKVLTLFKINKDG